ncbi:proteasome assembly chaperone 4 isoform X1 [Artibeus jamaicensis]|uniref:proteasome assembly chaperone 4 isoform X1 n=1 Tax=Artibeus jamaicensis TaxID=9417 RepID=UPI00235AA2CC|nr:proteasome assembly chaperone 4 isoform X1 [Artibeus jamaicensis]
MEGPQAAAGGPVSLHNFSARLWEQLVHFHVMRLTDSLFLWVGATPHLRNLAVAMCSRYSRGPRWPGRAQVPLGDGALCSLPGPEAEDSIPVSTSLLGDTSDTTSTGLAQRLGTYPWQVLQERPDGASLFDGTMRRAHPRPHGVTTASMLPGDSDVVPWLLSKPMGDRCFSSFSRKTNKQVFVSYNLQNADSNFALLVENRIKEEMEAFPEKF